MLKKIALLSKAETPRLANLEARTIWLFAVYVISACIIFLAVWMFDRSDYERSAEAAFNDLDKRISDVRLRYGQWLDRERQLLNRVSTDQIFLSMLDDVDKNNTAEARAQLMQYLKSRITLEDHVSFYVLDMAGRQIIGPALNNLNLDESTLNVSLFLQEVWRNQFSLSPPHKEILGTENASITRYVQDLGVPIRNNGIARGVLALRVRLDQLYLLTVTAGLRDIEDEILLFDKDSNLNARIMGDQSLIFPALVQDRQISDPNNFILAERAIRAQGAHQYDISTKEDGSQEFSIWWWDDDISIGMAIKSSEHVMLRQYKSTRVVLWISVIGVLAILGLILVMVQLEYRRIKQRQSDLNSILDHGHTAIVGLNKNGTVVLANAFAGKIFAMPSENMVGRNFPDLLMPEDKDMIRTWLEDTNHSTDILKVSSPVQDDQTQSNARPIRISLSPVRMGRGVTTLVHMSDNSALQASETLRSKLMTRYQAIFDNVLDSIIIYDELGRVMDANAVALRSLQYSRQEITDLNIRDLDPNFKVLQAESQWNISVRPVAESGRLRTKDGSMMLVNKHVVSFKDGDRFIFVLLAQSVMELTQVQNEVRTLKREMQDFVVNNKSYLMGLSHEVVRMWLEAQKSVQTLMAMQYPTPEKIEEVKAKIDVWSAGWRDSIGILDLLYDENARDWFSETTSQDLWVLQSDLQKTFAKYVIMAGYKIRVDAPEAEQKSKQKLLFDREHVRLVISLLAFDHLRRMGALNLLIHISVQEFGQQSWLSIEMIGQDDTDSEAVVQGNETDGEVMIRPLTSRANPKAQVRKGLESAVKSGSFVHMAVTDILSPLGGDVSPLQTKEHSLGFRRIKIPIDIVSTETTEN